jgi:hypothetical protein
MSKKTKTKSKSEPEYQPVSTEEYEALKSLRQKGYAVVVFNPEELQGVKPRYVEDELVNQAWVIIDALKD